MKILHLVHRAWPYHGGAERYVLEHALAGERWGHTSAICTTDAWDMSWLVSKAGRIIPVREDRIGSVDIIRFPVAHPLMQNASRALMRRLMPCGKDRFYYPNPFIPSLYRWLRSDHGFDFVHANAMPFMLYAGWKHASRMGIGMAAVPHANVGEKYRRADALHYFEGCQKKILRESSIVVAQSQFERDIYLEMGVPSERILVLGSGIDPQEFRHADSKTGRARLGLTRRPIILSLTAQCTDRGTGVLLKAANGLWDRGFDFDLVIAGPVLPDGMDEINRNATSSKESRLVITGSVTQVDRIDILAAADIVVLPSRLDCFGIVLLEAMLLRKPVVGCRSGAMPDIIEEGASGFLAPFGDDVTLAHRLSLLLDDRDLRLSMGYSGSEFVLDNFTWEKVTDSFYSRLAECRAGEEIE